MRGPACRTAKDVAQLLRRHPLTLCIIPQEIDAHLRFFSSDLLDGLAPAIMADGGVRPRFAWRRYRPFRAAPPAPSLLLTGATYTSGWLSPAPGSAPMRDLPFRMPLNRIRAVPAALHDTVQRMGYA